ncbi:hypothetical protein F5B22DRAFT_658746 [Xylaria bambusicola]|uniref:uncharacterized protein n=1 Tax=Xylaria bambusicola TaxID=326684 RepID=UPI0020081F74|nr:uncharacterized protein F5B22DRAFT_658746 [Xylaria bambusicola]KAI0508971.1 hypothetical protein F5B22DRAFT_658746 [Xylaria bambusicola]
MSATLCRLPPELKQNIMLATGSLQDILNVAVTCRAMYNALKDREGIITYTILSQEMDPDRLAIAVAHHAAVKAPWKYSIDMAAPIPADQTAYLNHVTAFCDLYLSKQATQLLLPIPSFTVPMGLYIENFDTAVENMELKIAYEFIPLEWPFVNMDSPTWAEMNKVARAFYILDMVLHLFPRSPVTLEEHRGTDPSKHDKPFTKFWMCFAPWESEQVEFLAWYINEEICYEISDYHDRCVSQEANCYLVFNGIIGFERVIGRRYVCEERTHRFKVLTEFQLSVFSESPFRREQYHEDRYRWFSPARSQNSHYHVVIKLETIRHYDVLESYGTAEMWVADCLYYATTHQHMLSELSREISNELRRKCEGNYIGGWIFQCIDRLRLANRELLGRDYFPELNDFRGIETLIHNLDPKRRGVW